MIKKFAAVIEIDTDTFNALNDDMKAFAIDRHAELLKEDIVKKLTEELNPFKLTPEIWAQAVSKESFNKELNEH